MKTKQKRVAIYIRTAQDTEESMRDTHSSEIQEQKLREYCEAQGYELNSTHVYKDIGASGMLEINKRHELKRLFRNGKQKRFDLVLVYRLDRLFRSSENLMKAIVSLEKSGIGFKSLTEEFDTETKRGKQAVNFFISLAQHQRKNIENRKSLTY